MAEDTGAERTEEATPRKRQRARERGHVARSRDLGAAAVLFAGCVFLRYGGYWMFAELMGVVKHLFTNMASLPIPTRGELVHYVPIWLLLFARVSVPFLLLVFMVALVSGFAQVGFNISAEAISLKFERLNPVEGLKRLFNLRAFVTLVMSLSKVFIVTAVAYLSFRTAVFSVKGLGGVAAPPLAAYGGQAMMDLMVRLAAVLLLLALADFWYQRHQYEVDLRMTRQEVREDLRETEGDPHVRQRRRQIQRQMAMQRMMAAVPQADVVIKNPTHYAVALHYDPTRAAQPLVVAKGMNNMALRILKVAYENNVPVKWLPWLARELHKLEVGDPIPEPLYQAVAEVLSWVVQTGRGRDLAVRLAEQPAG